METFRQTKNINLPKIGLALGSGGAKGLAHLGVLKVLEDNQIPIDYLSGSSMGALIGGLYAAGYQINDLEKLAFGINWRQLLALLFDPNVKLQKGLINGVKITKFLENYLKNLTFKDCRIPLAVAATDFKTGEKVILNSGELIPALRASISIPFIFQPYEMKGKLLVDGGLTSPVPVEAVRQLGAQIVVAVNLNVSLPDAKGNLNWYRILNKSINILQSQLALAETSQADLVLNIDTGKSYWYQFNNTKEIIKSGEKAMQEKLPLLKEILAKNNKK